LPLNLGQTGVIIYSNMNTSQPNTSFLGPFISFISKFY